jgi:hypothetical protein
MNTLTAEEVLDGRKTAITNLAKKAATYFEKMKKDCKILERGVDVSLFHSLVLPSFLLC